MTLTIGCELIIWCNTSGQCYDQTERRAAGYGWKAIDAQIVFVRMFWYILSVNTLKINYVKLNMNRDRKRKF